MLCNKHLELGFGKKKVIITENGYFFTFGANFLKLLQPYGSKNIFPQTFHPKGLWVQKLSKKSHFVTLLQNPIQKENVLSMLSAKIVQIVQNIQNVQKVQKCFEVTNQVRLGLMQNHHFKHVFCKGSTNCAKCTNCTKML